MAETPQTLRAALNRDESWRSKPYLDCCGKYWRDCTCKKKGKLSVGWGRNLDDVPLSMAAGDFLLDEDITAATADAIAALPWIVRIDEARREALINLRFNLGLAGLLKFRKMLEAAEQGLWATAAAELRDSKHREQTGSRNERLALQLETGERQ